MQDQSNSKIIVTRVTLTTINQEIAEREQYKREQEAIIEQIVNDGNNRLLNLNYDIEVAKKELKDLKMMLYELSREKYQTEEDLNNLKQDIRIELQRASNIPSFGI